MLDSRPSSGTLRTAILEFFRRTPGKSTLCLTVVAGCFNERFGIVFGVAVRFLAEGWGSVSEYLSGRFLSRFGRCEASDSKFP